MKQSLAKYLTYPEFLAKHAAKYKNLSAAQKRARYEDYVRVKVEAEKSKRQLKKVKSSEAGRSARKSSQMAHSLATLFRETGNMIPGIDFSSASERYLYGLADPFHIWPNGKVPKVPMGSNGLTMSFQVKVAATAYANTQGMCVVEFSPLLCGLDTKQCAWFTSAANTSAPGVFPAMGATGMDNATAKSQFAANNHLAMRIVNAGLRVVPTGQERLLSGIAYSVLQPFGASVETATEEDIVQVLYRSSSIHPVNDHRDVISVVWSPTVSAEAIWTGSSASGTANDSVNASHKWAISDLVAGNFAQPNMGVMVVGAEPGQPFYFEGIASIEFYAEAANFTEAAEFTRLATETESDPDAIAMADRSNGGVSLNATPKTKNGNVNADSFLNYLMKGASQVASLRTLSSKATEGVSLSQGTKVLDNGGWTTSGPGLPSDMSGFLRASPLEQPSAFLQIEDVSEVAPSVQELLPYIEEAPLLLA